MRSARYLLWVRASPFEINLLDAQSIVIALSFVSQDSSLQTTVVPIESTSVLAVLEIVWTSHSSRYHVGYFFVCWIALLVTCRTCHGASYAESFQAFWEKDHIYVRLLRDSTMVSSLCHPSWISPLTAPFILCWCLHCYACLLGFLGMSGVS